MVYPLALVQKMISNPIVVVSIPIRTTIDAIEEWQHYLPARFHSNSISGEENVAAVSTSHYFLGSAEVES